MEVKEYDFSKLYPVNNPLDEAALIWLDMETGGLNGLLENGELGCQYYPIFEIAIKVTNRELVELCEPLRLVIYQSEDMIGRSSSWALEKHKESGLLKEVRENGIELDTAERLILEHLALNGIGAYDKRSGTGGTLAGNGIFFDRSFILAQMPKINAYLYYRQFDVSAINLGARMWNHDLYEETRLAKEYRHEAMTDINESIDEAHVYKKRLEG